MPENSNSNFGPDLMIFCGVSDIEQIANGVDEHGVDDFSFYYLNLTTPHESMIYLP